MKFLFSLFFILTLVGFILASNNQHCHDDTCLENCVKKYQSAHPDVRGECRDNYGRVAKCQCFYGPSAAPEYIKND